MSYSASGLCGCPVLGGSWSWSPESWEVLSSLYWPAGTSEASVTVPQQVPRCEHTARPASGMHWEEMTMLLSKPLFYHWTSPNIQPCYSRHGRSKNPGSDWLSRVSWRDPGSITHQLEDPCREGEGIRVPTKLPGGGVHVAVNHWPVSIGAGY